MLHQKSEEETIRNYLSICYLQNISNTCDGFRVKGAIYPFGLKENRPKKESSIDGAGWKPTNIYRKRY
jgi:hypothetical protein